MFRYTLNGTHHDATRGLVKSMGAVEKDHVISTTWVLNPSLSQKDLDKTVADITKFCQQHNLIVEPDHPYHLKVKGNASGFNKALMVNMQHFEKENHKYHATTTPIKIPTTWKDKVHNILGLDTQKIAKPYFHLFKEKDITTTFYPTKLAQLYNFPTNLDGTNQKIGIIELGGGYNISDINTYFTQLGISTLPKITSVSVDGASNSPGDDADYEVVLDTEIIAAIVPGANIYVYFAPNSDRGFYDAINTSINQGCSIVSISWGAPETYWSTSSMSSYNSLFQSASTKNVTILAAAGDNGSSDGAVGNNVDFPSSSPYVLACGGTKLVVANDVSVITQETVWNNNSLSNATGGGISRVFAKPSYQNNVAYNLNGKRGVPDISGDADPNTGYKIYIRGRTVVIGGTSAVSPLWSGLLGRINQSIGHSVGYLQPTLYNNPSVCKDITQGNNGAFTASTGWDPCTGNGSPNGQALLNLLTSTNPPAAPVAAFTASPTSGSATLLVNFTDNSTNSPTSWSWNFGDNSTSNLRNPSHSYTNPGTYTVSLTATNTTGSNTITKNNYITATPQILVPVAAFSSNQTTGQKPLTVTFIDQSTNNPTSWKWTFGNGTTSTLQNPTYKYTNIGNYTVSLRATNSSGSNTVTKTNYIRVTSTANRSPPIAAFIGVPVTGRRPLSVQFTDQSSGNVSSRTWNFGDGVISHASNPTHIYNRAGNFTVTLTATNSYGSNKNTKSNYIKVTN